MSEYKAGFSSGARAPPLLEAAIKQLRDRSMSLDIYVWLAWRCHQLGKPRFHGRLEALGAATAAYPEARVEADDAGITLHPARPLTAVGQPHTPGY